MAPRYKEKKKVETYLRTFFIISTRSNFNFIKNQILSTKNRIGSGSGIDRSISGAHSSNISRDKTAIFDPPRVILYPIFLL